jgi:hypothetical protein
MIADLRRRGHQVLVYQQADNLYQDLLSNSRLRFFQQCPNVINEFGWRAVTWQIEQGVPAMDYGPQAQYVPDHMRHPAIGHHQVLNEFLADYILSRNMLTQ